MKSLSLFGEFRQFSLEIISWLPDRASKILVHSLLTVGIFQGWKIFRKQAKKFI